MSISVVNNFGGRAEIGKRIFGDRLTFAASLLAMAAGIGTLFFIALFVLIEAYPILIKTEGLLKFLYKDPWLPLAAPPGFGIFHAWLSTLIITGICLCLAVPMGFGIGLFVSEVAPASVRALLQPFLDLLAGIPSVVYGFFGYVTLLPWFESHFDMATGESVLVAGIILAVMSLPFIASTSAESFRSVPATMKEAALAQGVTRWYLVCHIVVPAAGTGMFAAAALGLARAIGETLAVLMLAGNSTAIPGGILDRGQPLTALIATELGEAGVGSEKYHSLFAAGFVLMAIIVVINMTIWILKGRFLYRA